MAGWKIARRRPDRYSADDCLHLLSATKEGSLDDMATTTRSISADELLRMPENGVRHELLRGELRTMTPPGAEHGRVAATVGLLLGMHAHKTGNGVTFAA